MDLRDLVRALLSFDALVARQWVAEGGVTERPISRPAWGVTAQRLGLYREGGALRAPPRRNQAFVGPMLRLRHQLYILATREALIESQHWEGARFARRLADEIVGKVG